MSATEAQLQAANVIDNLSLPQRKRKADEDDEEGSETGNKSIKMDDSESHASLIAEKTSVEGKEMSVKGRENRLEQNRKAARESRRRKKVMIEELQRSVIFFSRANGALKTQNDDLTRLLMQAQIQIATHNQKDEENAPVKPQASNIKEASAAAAKEEAKAANDEQTKANTVATQAIFESQGFPAAAARAAAQAVNGSMFDKASNSTPSLPPNASLPAMQPGATMQAMANFQQAAAAAMQQAMGQMKGVPGLTQMAATPVGGNPQHAFTDAMTAIAMQQAAAAHAAGVGQSFILQNSIQLLPAMVSHYAQAQQAAAVAATAAAVAEEKSKNQKAKVVVEGVTI